MENTIFALDTVSIGVFCRPAAQARRLARLWQTLFTLQPVEHSSQTVASIQFWPPSHPQEQPELVSVVQDSPDLQIWTTTQGFYLTCGASTIAVDIKNSRGLGVLSEDIWQQPLLAQRDFFLLTFMMLLRRHGLFGIHANGLVHDEKGVLIIGASGSGKTTLTLSLIRNGWRYLADDALMLRQTGADVEALALRRSFACTPQTMERFPELARAVDGPTSPTEDKQALTIEQLYPGQFSQRCTPTLLLFPTIAGGPQSRLVPLDQTETMMALMQNSAGILTDRQGSVQQMAMLKQLVEQAQSYRLLLGDDVFDAPATLSASLTAAPAR